jgi:hydrogenase expression/formation protein HypD
VVSREGNRPAQRLVADVFQVVTRAWRGIGEIPESGLGLTEAFAEYDAERRFDLSEVGPRPEPAECIAGLVLQGLKKPTECEAFGRRCTPEHPLGATMVSPEGACAAYHKHRRIAAGQGSTR